MTGSNNLGSNAEEWRQLLGEDNEKYIIEIPRSEKFISTAQAVSDYIKGLGISATENDKLVSLLVAHVLAAEESGFRFGLKIWLDYARSEESTS